ncbi:MAG: PLP-dependent aminotransferase family protein, partial [Anaerolineae bacterium]|nr:PLP-dependent aminotransferase family protein [Anaerolineae bacterium]
ALARQIIPRLEADGIHAGEGDIVVGSSAQQWIILGVQAAARLIGQEHPLVAVEEPGYAAIFDSLEYQGCRLVGMETDAHGVLPASLAQALAQGAAVVLLTPRALNPTGVTWSPERAAELAAVLSSYPGSIVIEDDHFAGLATSNPGSLLGYTAIQDRVIYVRSFSKSIAPDLRLAVAVARSPLRVLLAEAKSYADGWSSHLAQLSLAHILAQPELDSLMTAARDAYAERRAAATNALSVAGDLATVTPSADGVNLWVRLAPGIEAAEVVEQAAALGVLVAPGEPFYVRVGHNDSLRVNAGAVSLHGAAKAGEYLAEAIGRAAAVRLDAVVVV